MRKTFPITLLISLFLLLSTLNLNAQEEENEKELTFSQQIDAAFTPLVDYFEVVLFVDPFYELGIYDQQVYDDNGKPVFDENGNPVKAPLRMIVLWLLAGGIFFTVFLKFIGFRGLKHAINIIRGKYADKTSKGEVTPFQSVTTALSATVGMGNIAGVAIAISIGGPGATFWMIMAGLLGMSLKFAEVALGHKYRIFGKDGSVSGGPMYYLKNGLKKRGKNMGRLGVFLAFLFALTVMGGSIGGGNMLQANQAFNQLVVFFPSI